MRSLGRVVSFKLCFMFDRINAFSFHFFWMNADYITICIGQAFREAFTCSVPMCA